jgi:hypothetical protein
MCATKIKDVDLIINAKWRREFHVEKRLEDNHFFLSFTLAF